MLQSSRCFPFAPVVVRTAVLTVPQLDAVFCAQRDGRTKCRFGIERLRIRTRRCQCAERENSYADDVGDCRDSVSYIYICRWTYRNYVKLAKTETLPCLARFTFSGGNQQGWKSGAYQVGCLKIGSDNHNLDHHGRHQCKTTWLNYAQ